MEPIDSSIKRPQSNLVERPHKEINRILRAYIENKHTEWIDLVPFTQNCINNSVHEITGFTPISLFLNFQICGMDFTRMIISMLKIFHIKINWN